MHDTEDHGWQFLTGEPIDMEDAMLVCLSEVVALHPDVLDVADLPQGWDASRTDENAPWVAQGHSQHLTHAKTELRTVRRLLPILPLG